MKQGKEKELTYSGGPMLEWCEVLVVVAIRRCPILVASNKII